MRSGLKTAVQLVGWALPWVARRFILKRVLGYQVHSKAFVGRSIILANSVALDEGALIGNWNVLKNLDRLEMRSHSSITSRNLVTASGVPLRDESGETCQRELILEEHSAITIGHLIDANHSIVIGRFSTVAGYGSQLLTHSIDLVDCEQRAKRIKIGQYCFVGTRCVLLGGAALPDHCVLGAMSLLNKEFVDGFRLYGGTPARERKQ
ncbi:MAG: acyltransferase, partial [Planctomycetota bacterium]